MNLKDRVDYYIDNYHLLYPYDIDHIFKSITNYSNIKEKLENAKDSQLENVIKFFDSMLFFVDYVVFESRGLKFVLDDYDYLPTPSYRKVLIVSSLFEEYIVEIDEIMNNEVISERKLIAMSKIPQVKTKNDIEAIKKRVMVFPELIEYFKEILSELCFNHLSKLVYHHILDFKKDCIKLAYKMKKSNNKETKLKLLEMFINSPVKIKELLFEKTIVQNYDFDHYTNGKMWCSIYNQLKVSLL